MAPDGTLLEEAATDEMETELIDGRPIQAHSNSTQATQGIISAVGTTWRVDMNTQFAGSDASRRLVKPIDGNPRIENVAKPAASPGMLLVRVATVGMCRTDLLVAAGTIGVGTPTILGHEFSGWIEENEASEQVGLEDGTLIAGDPTFTLPDGRDGFMGVDADGVLAEWITIPADRVYRADGLTPHQAAYLEPVTAAMGGLPLAQAIGGRGAVIGDNRIATLTSAVLATAANPVPHVSMTLEQLEMEPDSSFDWLIETSLSAHLLAIAVSKLKAGGTLVIKSRGLEEVVIPVRDIVLKRLTLAGRTRSAFPEAMDWIRSQPKIVSSLLGEAYPFDRWAEAFAAAASGEGRKIFINVAADA